MKVSPRTESPPEVLRPEELAYISRLNECERRQFLFTKAISLREQGFSISKVGKIMKVSKNTIYKGIRELRTGADPGKGRIRCQGGGRKSLLSKGQPKSLDHDFAAFSDGRIVPHGIYDVTKNAGYMTIGTSHDTSKFVCDNIYRVWKEHLQKQYDNAHTLVIMCDGGGSNSSFHHIVNQDFMELADKLNMNLLIMHYPPYCSKFNPIEHRLFAHITRSWSGAPLLSIKDAAQRAARTTTVKGLTANVDINSRTYNIQRPIDESFEKKVTQRIVFQEKLPKWNYLIKPA